MGSDKHDDTVRTIAKHRKDIADLLALVAEHDRQIMVEMRKLVGVWPDFLDELSRKGFYVPRNFPATVALEAYYRYSKGQRFPLYDYGWFDIKELVAIIKVIQSYHRNKEYKIVTYACLNNQKLQSGDESVAAHVHFLVGLDDRIKHFQAFNGGYISDDINKEWMFDPSNRDETRKNIFRISQRGYLGDSGLEILFEDYDGSSSDKLTYVDFLSRTKNEVGFSSRYNIFDADFAGVLNRLCKESSRNVGSVLSFSVDNTDSYVAKALISIAAYKKRLGKKPGEGLSNDEYMDIFYELFDEDVDISKIIEAEIPRRLVRRRSIALR